MGCRRLLWLGSLFSYLSASCKKLAGENAEIFKSPASDYKYFPRKPVETQYVYGMGVLIP